jgi:heterodisulfide reductase subunit A-like polyferredoxin
MIQKIDLEKCTGCGSCVELCPLDTLGLDPFQTEIPPCQEACPAGADFRGVLYFLKRGMQENAVGLLREHLPFPAITGRICYHPCESKCNRKEVDESVSIRSLECFLGDLSMQEKMQPLPLLHAAKVAIAGSGPGGLSAAYFLIRMGYRVSVFEAGAELGGMLRKEVLKGRLPGQVLEQQITWIQGMGVDFKTKTAVGKDMTLQDLKDSRYRALVLATGCLPEGPDAVPGLERKKGKQTIPVDPITAETKTAGIFACGGAVRERAPVVKVIASAKALAVSVDRYLKGRNLRDGRERKTLRVKSLPGDGIKQIPKERIFEAVDGSLEERVEREARRCLSCGAKAFIAHPEDCMTCFECEVECPTNAIKVHPFKEVLPMTLALD